jgi:hypothetical protein
MIFVFSSFAYWKLFSLHWRLYFRLSFWRFRLGYVMLCYVTYIYPLYQSILDFLFDPSPAIGRQRIVLTDVELSP